MAKCNAKNVVMGVKGLIQLVLDLNFVRVTEKKVKNSILVIFLVIIKIL